jgi:hypothetical protein
MSDVEQVERVTQAVKRGDIEAVLEDLDPEVEWSPAFPVLLGGEKPAYRGHEGVREMFRLPSLPNGLNEAGPTTYGRR